MRRRRLSRDIHTHTPARKSYTNFQLYYFVIQICSTNCLGHRHGHECHSPMTEEEEEDARDGRAECSADSSKRQRGSKIARFLDDSRVR